MNEHDRVLVVCEHVYVQVHVMHARLTEPVDYTHLSSPPSWLQTRLAGLWSAWRFPWWTTRRAWTASRTTSTGAMAWSAPAQTTAW